MSTTFAIVAAVVAGLVLIFGLVRFGMWRTERKKISRSEEWQNEDYSEFDEGKNVRSAKGPNLTDSETYF